MTPPSAVTVLASAAQTTTGTGASVDLGTAIDTLRLTLFVTAVTGTTPTLVVTIESSTDNAVWRVVRAWPQKTAAGEEYLVFQPVDRYVRAKWTIGGTATPTFTFHITGEKLKPYATVAYLLRTHNSAQFSGISTEDLEAGLAAASADAASRLANRYTLPLTAWGDDLRKKVCSLACWTFLSERRGFNPEAGADIAVRTNYVDADRWLKDVAGNMAHPLGAVDSTPTVEESGAVVITDTSRGWRR